MNTPGFRGDYPQSYWLKNKIKSVQLKKSKVTDPLELFCIGMLDLLWQDGEHWLLCEYRTRL